MSLNMNQVGGLGQAGVIAAILGPVVSGGADAFRTYEESRLSKKELKQRQLEFAQMSKLKRDMAEAQSRNALMAQQISLQKSSMRGAWWQQNLPLIAGGVVLVALAVAAVSVGRR